MASFLDTLAEAKRKVQEVGREHLGRGFRTIKNTDYYSPAEEEERHKYKEAAKEKEKGTISFRALFFFVNLGGL